MALILRRAPSTLSREVARTRAPTQPYRACTAQTRAIARTKQHWRQRKLLDSWLWQYVRSHLWRGCLPEQIAGRLTREYPHDMQKQCSTETIYAALSALPRGMLRSELLTMLRQARKTRRPWLREMDRCGQLPTITPLADRPAAVATRTVPGHWEGDLLKGARNSSAVWNGRLVWFS